MKVWEFQDVPVVGRSTSRTALDLLAGALPFAERYGEPPADGLKLDLEFGDPLMLPAWLDQAEVLYASETGWHRLCRIGEDPVVSIADLGLARLFTAERRIQLVATTAVEADAYLLTQALLAPLLGPALRPWGLLAIHACAVDWQGRAIVFPAASGSGKSTLALGLLRAGFRLLSDDAPILQRRPDGSLRLLAFPEPLRVLPDTLARCPEASTARTEPSGNKLLLDPRQLYSNAYVAESVPALIVMPRISGQASSSIRDGSADEALKELVGGIAFGSTGGSIARDLPLLAQLVNDCRIYSLETGTDFDHLAVLLRDLLADCV
jgi:hypothetical protein